MLETVDRSQCLSRMSTCVVEAHLSSVMCVDAGRRNPVPQARRLREGTAAPDATRRFKAPSARTALSGKQDVRQRDHGFEQEKRAVHDPEGADRPAVIDPVRPPPAPSGACTSASAAAPLAAPADGARRSAFHIVRLGPDTGRRSGSCSAGFAVQPSVPHEHARADSPLVRRSPRPEHPAAPCSRRCGRRENLVANDYPASPGAARGHRGDIRSRDRPRLVGQRVRPHGGVRAAVHA